MAKNAPDPRRIRTAPAAEEAPHATQNPWRGLAECAAVAGQGLLALSELIRPRRDDVEPPQPRRHGAHPVEKSAPFPIND